MFRVVVVALGALLGLASLWMLSIELIAPRVLALPTNRAAAASAASRHGEAIWSARLGLVRGDLWSDAAYTQADLIWADGTDAEPLEQAKSNASRAVSLMPVNPGVWLMLAILGFRYGDQVANSIESLKMSYYTGPHEDGLIRLRLSLAARLNITADPELERLFRGEVETVLTNRTNFRPALTSAYAVATPSAQRTIEETAKRIDPAFAQTLHAGSNP